MAEPIDHLLSLLDLGFGKICFGSSGKFWQVGSDAWERRADEAFNAICRRGELPWIHMLRGLGLSGDKWPFASADSANVARHHNELKICPERMARRIDAVQCPASWDLRHEQMEMFS